jgi:hypothetical protein
MSDGASYEYIDQPVHRAIYDMLNREQFKQICVVHNPTISSIYFFFADTVDGNNILNQGWSFDYGSNAWSELDFVRSAGVSGAAFDYSITGGTSGLIYVQSVPESGDIPSTENPVKVEDGVLILCPHLWGQGGWGDGFWGGTRAFGPFYNPLFSFTEDPDNPWSNALTFAESNVTMYITDEFGNTYPIGIVSDTSSFFVESEWLDLSQKEFEASLLIKFIDQIAVVLKNKDLADNFQIIISYRYSLDDVPVELSPINLQDLIGTATSSDWLDGHIYDRLPDEAVYFKFRFEDTQIVDPSWHLTQFDIYGSYIGERP